MTEWTAPRDARGSREPTYRSRKTGAIAEPPESEATLNALYVACQCPCGCDRTARSFAPDWSERPDLCGACQPPSADADHARPLTDTERAILARPVHPAPASGFIRSIPR